MLKDMMERGDGGFAWKTSHNSKFETTKSLVMDFSRSRMADHLPLMLQGMVISSQKAHKFLGVLLDQELRWGQQASLNIGRAMKWTLAFHRLARPSVGIRPGLMRQLYTAVAVPKMEYAVDVWYTPVYSMAGRKKLCGSVGYMHKMAMVQRLALMAITGALHTTVTDVLDAHANLLPIDLLLHKICHREEIWMASLLDTHLISALFRVRERWRVKSHRSPLHELAYAYELEPDQMEKICLVRFAPCYVKRMTTRVAESTEEAAEQDLHSNAEV